MLYQTENPHGGDIYAEAVRLDFSANINPLGTPRGVLAAMQTALFEVEHYPDPYCRALVAAIAAHEEVAREAVLCGNGAAELIYAYCGATRPKRAVVLAPTFAEYALALAQAGCEVVRFALREEYDFALQDDILPFLAEARPDVLFLCSPNNPTGRLIAPALLSKILARCAAQGTRVFLDACFLDLTEGNLNVNQYLREYSELFILKAFTKSYAMAGIRLGYGLSADGALLGAMAQGVQPWNVSLVAQAGGIAALREEDFLQKSRKLIADERHRLREELKSCGFWVCPSDANFLLFRAKAGLRGALLKEGIAIRSCENDAGLGAGWYRTAVRTHEENARLIVAIRSICDKNDLPYER